MKIGPHIQNPIIYTKAQPDSAEERRRCIDGRGALESVILCLETDLEVVFEDSGGNKHYMAPSQILEYALSQKWEG
jgi:hypothetical protein